MAIPNNNTYSQAKVAKEYPIMEVTYGKPTSETAIDIRTGETVPSGHEVFYYKGNPLRQSMLVDAFGENNYTLLTGSDGRKFVVHKGHQGLTDSDIQLFDWSNSDNSFDKALAQAYKSTGLKPNTDNKEEESGFWQDLSTGFDNAMKREFGWLGYGGKDSSRYKAIQAAKDKDPNFMQNWDTFVNVNDGINWVSDGLYYKLAPSQMFGFARDVANGKNVLEAWFTPNSGFFTEEYAANNPVKAFAGNFIGDVLFGIGANKVGAGKGLKTVSASDDLRNGQYVSDAVKASSHHVPNFITKPLKQVEGLVEKGRNYVENSNLYKNAKNFVRNIEQPVYRLTREAGYYVDDILRPWRTYKNIKNNTYIPLMSKQQKQAIIQKYRRMAEDALGSMSDYYDLDAMVYDSDYNYWTDVFDFADMTLGGQKQLRTPSLDLVPLHPRKELSGAWGIYSPRYRNVSVRAYDNHNVRSVEDFLHTTYHEGGHDAKRSSSALRQFTTPYKNYYSVNENNPEAVRIFESLIKRNKRGDWASSPDEFMAELIAHKRSNNITTSVIESPKINEIAAKMAKRFNIKKHEARQIIYDLSAYGFKNGGKLKQRFK